MANILSEKSKRDVRGEYRLRFAVLTLALISTALVVLALLLLPAFWLLRQREAALAEQVATSAATEESAPDSAKQVLERTASKLALRSSNVSLTEPLRAVTAAAANKVALLGVSLQRAADVTQSSDSTEAQSEVGAVSIAISGFAPTRTRLLAFRDALRRQDMFTAVTLPVSYLAEDRNIEFNLTATVSVPSNSTE